MLARLVPADLARDLVRDHGLNGDALLDAHEFVRLRCPAAFRAPAGSEAEALFEAWLAQHREDQEAAVATTVCAGRWVLQALLEIKHANCALDL